MLGMTLLKNGNMLMQPKRLVGGSELNCLVMPEDYEILNKQDDVTLAQWNCKMNSWEWPEELPNEPKDIDVPMRERGTNGRRSQMMAVIEERVGRRLISWEWNKDRMSIEEFNDFYDGTYKGDKEARTRYKKRLNEKCGIEA